MALSPLENNTLALMRYMMDPTRANLSDIPATEIYETTAPSFDEFSEEFFETVAADEILSIYDQEHLRNLVRLSCELLYVSVDNSPMMKEIHKELGLDGDVVINSTLFFLTNPSIEFESIRESLFGFDLESAEFLATAPWAMFVYNPRGAQLFEECFEKVNPNSKLVQFLFLEMDNFAQMLIQDHDESVVSWGNWIGQAFEEARVNQRACRGEDMFAMEGWDFGESWDNERILGDEFFVHRGKDADYVREGFKNFFFPTIEHHWTLDAVVSRYTSLARWVRSLARIDGEEEPTFALERVF